MFGTVFRICHSEQCSVPKMFFGTELTNAVPMGHLRNGLLYTNPHPGEAMEKLKIPKLTVFPKCIEGEGSLGVWDEFPKNTGYLFGNLPFENYQIILQCSPWGWLSIIHKLEWHTWYYIIVVSQGTPAMIYYCKEGYQGKWPVLKGENQEKYWSKYSIIFTTWHYYFTLHYLWMFAKLQRIQWTS